MPDEEIFANLRHARHLIAAWCDDYNNHRPHSSLYGLTRGSITKSLKRTKP